MRKRGFGRTGLGVGAALACGVAGGSGLLPEEFLPEGFAPLPGAVVAYPAPASAALEGCAAPLPLTLCTNVLSLAARYSVAPRPGRAATLEVSYRNLTQGVVALPGFGRATGPEGVRYLALLPGGGRRLVSDERGDNPNNVVGLEPGAEFSATLRLTPAASNALAGAEGMVVAYVARMASGWYLYAESAPLAVLAEPWEDPPPPLTAADWQAMLTNWVAQGVMPWPREVLHDYPDAAPFYPGVVVDPTLPESFRIAFANRMPMVDAWEPDVLAAVTNAPVKDAPLVLAMLKVLRRSGGPSPEEQAARRAINPLLYAMSQDTQNPLLFRLHAAHTFPMHIPIDEFNLRTEPHFRLLAADTIRQHRGGSYYEADRVQLRAGLTALSTDTTPFVAGPLAGKYPENATVGQVASIILADLEAKWAAEPPRQP